MIFVGVVLIVAGLAAGFWLRDSNARWLNDRKGHHHE